MGFSHAVFVARAHAATRHIRVSTLYYEGMVENSLRDIKRLIIMRHAEADWGMDDFDRPLTKRGHRQAADAGSWLKQKGYIPEQLMLTFKEFELLAHLVENSTRTVGRDELLESLWSAGDEHPHERTIDVHIRRLRSKLGRLSGTVRTVRGQGYRFFEHPEVVVWAAPEYSI